MVRLGEIDPEFEWMAQIIFKSFSQTGRKIIKGEEVEMRTLANAFLENTPPPQREKLKEALQNLINNEDALKLIAGEASKRHARILEAPKNVSIEALGGMLSVCQMILVAD